MTPMHRILLTFVIGLLIGTANTYGAPPQLVNIGQTPNDGTGDSLRTAFTKVNSNFTNLWSTRMGTVATLNELLSFFPTDLHTNVFVVGRTNANDGFQGIFTYLAGSTLPTNNGTVFRPIVVTGRWVRQVNGAYDSSWFGTTASNINELFMAGAGNTILLPKNTTVQVDVALSPQSGSHIIGDNTTLVNGTTNTPNFIILDIIKKRDILLENFTVDGGLGSHYTSGNIWIRACTNVVARRIVSKYGGKLGLFAIVGYETEQSEECGAEFSEFLDQRYGGLGSIAAYGVAETAKRCFSRYNRFNFPTLGKMWLGWGIPPFVAPSLTTSFDRSQQGYIIGDQYRNTSGMTNLVAVMFEDNNRTPGSDNTLENVLIDGYDIGIAFAYLDGTFSFRGTKVRNCTRHAIRLNQVEPADYHRVRVLRLIDCDFENSYPNPTFGRDQNNHWQNKAGQIIFTADLPQRLEIELCRFKSNSTDPQFTHLLYGAGELISKRNIFEGGAYGIRAADPAVLDTEENGLWNATPQNRKTFVSDGDRFISVANPIYGVSSPRELEAGIDGVQYVLFNNITKTVPTNALTTLFSIKTVETASSAIGTSGSYDVVLDGHISNASAAVSTLGQVGARRFHAEWTHTVNYDAVNTCTNSIITGWATPQAQVGARGFINPQFTLSNGNYHTTDVKLQLEGLGDVTEANVFCRIQINYLGLSRPPIVIK